MIQGDLSGSGRSKAMRRERWIGANGVGRVSIELVVANNDDMVRAKDGTLAKGKVRRLTIRGVVDSGANKLVLPGKVVKELGLPLAGKVKVRYANGQSAIRDMAEGVHVELLGRHGTFRAVVEPKRDTALVGAIVLEDLDLLVDCPNERVVPRDPKIQIQELE
jgi:predicted aspartyl protease